MPREELRSEMQAGVEFFCIRRERRVIGVMGLQRCGRRRAHSTRVYAYLGASTRRRALACSSTSGAKLIGRCWWARGKPPPGRCASTSVAASGWCPRKKRRGCCGATGPFRSARSRNPWSRCPSRMRSPYSSILIFAWRTTFSQRARSARICSAKCARRIADGLDAERCVAAADLGLAQHRGDLLLQPLERPARRLRRGQDAGPGVDHEAAPARSR